MSLEIKTLINSPISSNCHVLIDESTKKCILIDPGSENSNSLDDFLENRGIIPEYILLTHEHFDHIWSCQYLYNKYSAFVICSKECSSSIKNARSNLSFFYEDKGFESHIPCTKTEDLYFHLNWNGNHFHFINTPGHSPGSIIILINEKYIVTGDTLIKDTKTITKLKNGSNEQLLESLKLIEKLKGKGLIALTGHGDNFQLDNYNLNKAI